MRPRKAPRLTAWAHRDRSGSDLISLAEAERRLGMQPSRGRKLQRYLRARERDLGRQIIVDLGTRRKRRERVTLHVLRQTCPALFRSRVDTLVSGFRKVLTRIDAHTAELVDARVAAYVDPRVRELWQRDEQIAESVQALGARVERLTDGLRMPAVSRKCAHGVREQRGSEPKENNDGGQT